MKKQSGVIGLIACSVLMLNKGHSAEYAGHRVIEKNAKDQMVMECKAKKGVVFSLAEKLLKQSQTIIQEIIPDINQSESKILAQEFMSTYSFDGKNESLGILVAELKVQIQKTEDTFLNNTQATLEDANFYGTQCGSLSSALTVGHNRLLGNEQLLVTGVNTYLGTRFCPKNVTVSQLKEIKKRGFYTLGATKIYAGKSIPSSATGLLASKPKLMLTKLRSYPETIACDYTLDKKTPFNLYYTPNFKTLSQIKSLD